MIIERRRPFARGVDELMFVGDADSTTVEKATAMPDPKQLGVMAVAALVAWKSKGIVRLASAGIAAVMGYRAYQATKP